MKRILMMGILVLMVLGMAGCGLGTGVRNETENLKNLNISPQSKIIYYQPVFYKAGFFRWNWVASTPELEPNESLIKFKRLFLEETRRLLEEKGYLLRETDSGSKKDPSSFYIEMRLAFHRGITALRYSTSATRWVVFCNNQPIFEVYNVEKGSILRPGVEEIVVKAVAEETVQDFIKEIERLTGAVVQETPNINALGSITLH